MPEKYQHNKFIFFAVQRFLGQTKRCYFIEENKPARLQVDPPNQNQNQNGHAWNGYVTQSDLLYFF